MKLTKEQVLKNLEEIVRFGGLAMSSEFVESVRIAMEAYENQQDWIPFSKELPEAFVSVLRTVKSFGWNCTEHTYVDVGCICPIDKNTVLAWMPLPEPYKESEDKK